MTTTQITYRKTRQGAWVAYGPADAVKAGEVVNIAKKNGQISRRLVESTGKVFIVDGERMVYGYLAEGEVPTATTADQHAYTEAAHEAAQAAAKAGTLPARKAPATRTYPTTRAAQCDECGRQARTLIPARDMSGIPGMVCTGCKRNEAHLSFA